MNKTLFTKNVINETDKLLTKHDTLDVTEWALYEDYPYVGVEDLRGRSKMSGPDFNVDISEFNTGIFGRAKDAANEVIKEIEKLIEREQSRGYEETYEDGYCYPEDEDEDYEDENEDDYEDEEDEGYDYDVNDYDVYDDDGYEPEGEELED